MTQDEIIAMARQVGYPIQHPEWQKATEEFAALVEEKVAAKEREECAMVLETHTPTTTPTWVSYAAAIRARGQA